MGLWDGRRGTMAVALVGWDRVVAPWDGRWGTVAIVGAIAPVVKWTL